MSRIISFRRPYFKQDGNFSHFGYWGPNTNNRGFTCPETNLWAEIKDDQQFTGLLDKNGKEIFEGDILCPFLESIGPYWVVFENGSFVCYHKHGRWGLLSRVFEADILQDYQVEVIGNIYSNPDLLKHS